jgi:YidC/Oxa1 family membrane protein insertase
VSLGSVVFTPSVTNVQLSPSQPEETVTFRGQTEDGMVAYRTYHFSYNSYTFQVSTWVEGARPAADNTITLVWGPGFYQAEEEHVKRQGQTTPLPRGYISGKIFHDAPKQVGEAHVEQGDVSWAALGDTYFTAVLLPQEPPAKAMIVRRTSKEALEVGIRTPLDDSHRRQTVQVYVGPKDPERLTQVDPSLGKYLIDLGFFSVLARPMLQLLIFVNKGIHNYGVTIILVTILIKIVLWPLTQSSYKSMQAMQRLQPKMKELQAIYKDDRQALNRAMMQLYRDEKANPMGGCLPMVLQIPVFFAFYNALLYSLELRHAPFICWEEPILWLGRGICDLSVYDPTYITPALMGISMFFQQKMSPTSADPAQAKMMQFMPLFFLLFFLWAPAGLVIYWLMNNVLSIAQQMIINRTYRPATAKAEVAGRD